MAEVHFSEDSVGIEDRIRFGRDEVHFIIHAPPAYHASMDGFLDEKVEEQVVPEELTLRELRSLAAARGLRKSGNKRDLIRRLRAWSARKAVVKKSRNREVNFESIGFYNILRRTRHQHEQQGQQNQERERCVAQAQEQEQEGQVGKAVPGGILKREKQVRPRELKLAELRRELERRQCSLIGLRRKAELVALLESELKRERRNRLRRRLPLAASARAPPAGR